MGSGAFCSGVTGTGVRTPGSLGGRMWRSWMILGAIVLALVPAAPARAQVPPETTILSGPEGPTNDGTPEFTFSSDPTGGDVPVPARRRPVRRVHSPQPLDLADGDHTFPRPCHQRQWPGSDACRTHLHGRHRRPHGLHHRRPRRPAPQLERHGRVHVRTGGDVRMPEAVRRRHRRDRGAVHLALGRARAGGWTLAPRGHRGRRRRQPQRARRRGLHRRHGHAAAAPRTLRPRRTLRPVFPC